MFAVPDVPYRQCGRSELDEEGSGTIRFTQGQFVGRCTNSVAGKQSSAPYLWMLAGCWFTAWMGQLAHQLKDQCDWRIVALARGSIAFVLAIGLARLSGAKLVFWRPHALWLRGCASSVSLLCTFFALAQLPTSEVMTLTNTFPIWVAFLSWPLLQVRPSLSVWLAAGCGVCGVALIQSPHFQADPNATFALVLSLTAAFTNAIAMLGLHRIRGVHPWAIVVHYSGVATLFVLASLFIGPVPHLDGIGNMKSLILLVGVGATATLGQVCVTRAFTAGAPARVSVVGLMQIVFALGLDLLFQGASMCGVTLAGIGLVLAPTAWMMFGQTGREKPHYRSNRETPLHPSQARATPGCGGVSDLATPADRRSPVLAETCGRLRCGPVRRPGHNGVGGTR